MLGSNFMSTQIASIANTTLIAACLVRFKRSDPFNRILSSPLYFFTRSRGRGC